MAKPPKKEFNLKERIEKIRTAGLVPQRAVPDREGEPLLSFPERIKDILHIIQSKPIKSTTMNYLVLYDIENNKVRTLVAKFLLKRGCIRVQKSVFLGHSEHKKFDEIQKTLAEIND